MARIETLEELRSLYNTVKPHTAKKELDELDIHSRRILLLSPFCLIGSSDGKGNADVTPRGDAPGFVQAYDSRTLLVPDRPGNNRLDTYTNILTNSSVGMLFLIPGIGETLRINGDAEIRDDEDLLERCAINGRLPKTVMMVSIQTIFIHCPKSIIRSKLWNKEAQIKREALPTLGQMLRDQSGVVSTDESDEGLIDRLNKTLW
ncbi:MAG: pyridoxamine 5'-phosphate oxidase family protein [Hyphomicrobiales bacterium]